MSTNLVIVVPSNEGLVVAADGSATRRGPRQLDATEFNVVRPARVVFAVTGTSRIRPRPSNSSALERWFSRVVPSFDGTKLVKRQLRRLQPDALDEEWVAALSARFVQALGRQLSRDPAEAARRPGREVCCVVLAQFQRAIRQATIASFLIRVNESGGVEAGENLFKTFRPDDAFVLLKFGETLYLSKYVLGRAGRRYLAESLYRRIEAADRIAELDAGGAAQIARGLILAASRTAAEVSGLPRTGERMQMLLVDGSDSVARELHVGNVST